MQTLQIDEKKARGLYKTASPEFKSMLEDTFGLPFFSEKITDRIKTLADVFEAKGIADVDFYAACKSIGLRKDEIAYRLLTMIAEVLNEGWVPDWNNSNERKWRPWFYMNNPGFRLCSVVNWYSYTHAGARQHFKTEDLCRHSVDCFLDVYKDYFTY
jgi:hypothetical protein